MGKTRRLRLDVELLRVLTHEEAQAIGGGSGPGMPPVPSAPATQCGGCSGANSAGNCSISVCGDCKPSPFGPPLDF